MSRNRNSNHRSLESIRDRPFGYLFISLRSLCLCVSVSLWLILIPFEFRPTLVVTSSMLGNSRTLRWHRKRWHAARMPSVPCRQCSTPVNPDDAICAHCGAVQPGAAEMVAVGFEWQTPGKWAGLPWIHIAFGHDAAGRGRTARGVIAIGQRAVGGVAIGIVALGFFSIGFVALGVFSFGVVAFGGLMACGLNALAPMAVGVVAVGYKVGGLVTFGWKTLFSAWH